MKLLLINPSSNTHYPIPPLGLLQLAACVKQHGHKVRLIDSNIEHDYHSIAWADVIGFTAVTSTINEAIRGAKVFKEIVPKKPIIIGGPHVSILPVETLETGAFDMAMVGESDKVLPELLDTIEGDLPVDDIPNLYCYQDGSIWETQRNYTPVPMDILPIPAYDMIDINRYRPHPPHARKRPWLPVITSRGCPYSCTFCSKPVFGNTYRALDSSKVVGQLSALKDLYNIREIAFYDDIFNLDFNRAYDICQGIGRLGIDWSCESRANLVDKYILGDFRKAGCFLIAYGIESGSQRILDKLNKGLKIEQIKQAIAYSREAGIQTVGYFMIGNPGETIDDIDKTIAFAIKLKLDYAQFAITVPLPGSKLYEEYISNHDCIPEWEAFSYANMGNVTTPMFDGQNLTTEAIRNALSLANRKFYLRLGYMWQRGTGALKSWADFKLLINGFKLFLENR